MEVSNEIQSVVKALEILDCVGKSPVGVGVGIGVSELSAQLGINNTTISKMLSTMAAGANENTNRLIREYLPKRLDFSDVRNDDVLRIEERLNNRPHKCLGFRSPKEVFWQLTCCV